MAPRAPEPATPMRPSQAILPDRFAAADSPFLRSQSTAASRSPFVSISAFLQSIIPAFVLSRSAFTRLALISAICSFLQFEATPLGGDARSRMFRVEYADSVLR